MTGLAHICPGKLLLLVLVCTDELPILGNLDVYLDIKYIIWQPRQFKALFMVVNIIIKLSYIL